MNASTRLQPVVATVPPPRPMPLPSQGDNIRRIATNARQDPLASIPSKVRIGHSLYDIVDISIGGFAVEIPSKAVPLGAIPDCEISARSNGQRITFSLGAVAVWIDADSGRAAFRVVDIGSEEQGLLRQLITSHLNGAEPVATLTTENIQPLFPDPVQPHLADDSQNDTDRLRKAVGYTVWTLFVLLLAALLVITLFNRIFTVSSISAAITAPSVEIRAPASGLVTSRGIRPGDRIMRDQELVSIDDPDLAFRLTQARATTDTAVTPFMADHELRLAVASLNALETRLAKNAIFSPCDCIVYEITGANGGEWTEIGERLMTLIPIQPNAILVEARIAAADANRISENQNVVLTFPMTGETVEGTVETIVSQNAAGQRVGTPEWYSRDDGNISVLVRTSEPLSPEVIGQPAQMTTAFLTLRGLWNTGARYGARLRNLAGIR